MVSLRYTRSIFLRSLCIVYLFAFISFYIQTPGLYGDNGLLPAKSVLENSKHKTLSAKVHYQPTLLWLAPYLALDTNYALDVLSLFGSFLAFTGFISQKFCTISLFGALWSLYFSLYQVGQVFVSKHYDELLLEVGFLTLFVAPLVPGKRKVSKNSATDAVGLWLIKWLLFRYLLTSGLSKLISGCPKWWSLTAFNYHFQSMPLPSPLSWYSHYLPEWVLMLTNVYVNVVQIALPFLFFVPIRSVRITGFIFQIFLQICIVLTGNFNFENLLVVTLLISLLDDQFFYGKKKSSNGSVISYGLIANSLIYGALFYGVVILYSIKIEGSVVQAKIAFTKENLDFVLKNGLPITVYYGLVSLGITILGALSKTLFDGQSSTFSKIVNGFSTILYSLLALLIFLTSTVPLTSLHSATNSSIHPSIRTTYNRLHKIHAINQYGLFTKMNGVDGRLEIVLEGADRVDGPWVEYNFLYKPGNVNHSLPYVAPYSPRIDWQMYWAAQSTYDKQGWLLSLTHRLLLGTPEVIVLLDRYHSPYIQKPPKFIKASLYKYHYSPWNQRSQQVWWKRVKVNDYFPPFSKDSPALIDYLKARNLLPTAPKHAPHPLWKQILDSIRYVASHFEASLLLWSVFTAGCAIITTSGSSKK